MGKYEIGALVLVIGLLLVGISVGILTRYLSK